MSEDLNAAAASLWMAEIVSTIRKTIPPPFTFVLAVYAPDDPVGALLLSPQSPGAVAPMLRALAETIEEAAR